MIILTKTQCDKLVQKVFKLPYLKLFKKCVCVTHTLFTDYIDNLILGRSADLYVKNPIIFAWYYAS